MKIRDYQDIEAKVNPLGISLRLLTGDLLVPNGGGAWFVPTVCGAGKSTAIAHLISKVGDGGVLLLCSTMKDCDVAQQRLINVGGMNSQEILVLHTESQVYNDYQQRPTIAATYKVVIITSIRVNIDVLEPLLEYNGGKRKYIIFDEIQLFSKELYHIDWKLLGSFVQDVDTLSPRSVEDMAKVKNKFFPPSKNTELAKLRDNHILQQIHDNFSDLIRHRRMTVSLYQYTKDVVAEWSKQSTVICLDATIDIMFGNTRKSPFKMLKSNDKYSSPVTFKQFTLPVERWVFTEQKVDQSDIDNTLSIMADIMANQIDSLGQDEKILFMAWLYLDYKQCDPDGSITKDRRIDLLTPLEEILDDRGYTGRYDIIYRGSGDGKGSNDFRDFTAISFLGNWSVNEQTIKSINKNLGIRCDIMNYMTAMMVQNICRLRIRKHDGEPIIVFYSSDIDPRLMSQVFCYFKKRSDNPQSITGVPMAQDVVDRPVKFLKDVLTLCNHVPGLLDAIANRDTSFKLDVLLNDMYEWFKKGKMDRNNCKSRCFYNLAQKIKNEYNIELLINGKPVPKR